MSSNHTPTRGPGASKRAVRRVAGGLAVAALLAAPSPALAHDSFTGSTPENGDTTAEAPQEVQLGFSAEPQDVGLEIRVSGPDGTDVTDGEPEIAGRTVTQALSEEASAAGEYSVVWRVVSSDGHPIEGAYDYTVEGETAADGQSAEPTQEAPSESAGSAETDEASHSAAPEADTSASDTVEDKGSGLAVWLVVGGSVVLLGAVAAAVVMMRRMGR